mgnify:CR=1 FL=1
MFAFILRHFYFAFNFFFFQTFKYLSYVPHSLRCICRGVTIVYLKWYAPPYERVLTLRQNLSRRNMCTQVAFHNISRKIPMQAVFSLSLSVLNPFLFFRKLPYSGYTLLLSCSFFLTSFLRSYTNWQIRSATSSALASPLSCLTYLRPIIKHVSRLMISHTW